MIGHYLMTLTQEQEDRVLTNKLAPGALVRDDGQRCLLGVAENWTPQAMWSVLMTYDKIIERPHLVSWCNGKDGRAVGGIFDELCARFGETRINAAIRNR